MPARNTFYDLHFLPVIGEFLAAIEARDIRACKGSSLRLALSRPLGDRKAKPLVCAPE